MDVCLQCHLETTSEPLPSGTRRAGRSAYSYRPGQPLSEYMVHFDHPPGTGHDDKFEIAGGAYRLRMSACFLKSQGRLTCTSCHDPHNVARGEAAAAHYNDRCRQCHQAAHPERAMPDCVDCHMPKRRTDDAVHVVMTDHWIQRRQPSRDLLAPLSEKAAAYKGDIVFYFPETLHEADRETYLGIALAAHGADTARGIALLERAALRGGEASQPKIWAALGDARMAQGNLKEAVDAYLKALTADQGLEKARYNCAQAFEQMGDLAGAEREYRRLTSWQEVAASIRQRLSTSSPSKRARLTPSRTAVLEPSGWRRAGPRNQEKRWRRRFGSIPKTPAPTTTWPDCWPRKGSRGRR
jgi:predicted CXXCH cytochrome family protein